MIQLTNLEIPERVDPNNGLKTCGVTSICCLN